MTSEEKNLILETLKDYELGDKVTLGAVSKILEEMVDDTAEDKIREDAIRKFAIWLDTNGYMRKMDLNISRVEEALYEYKKEKKNDGNH